MRTCFKFLLFTKMIPLVRIVKGRSLLYKNSKTFFNAYFNEYGPGKVHHPKAEILQHPDVSKSSDNCRMTRKAFYYKVKLQRRAFIRTCQKFAIRKKMWRNFITEVNNMYLRFVSRFIFKVWLLFWLTTLFNCVFNTHNCYSGKNSLLPLTYFLKT